jgi:hypothetical protein
MSTAPDAAWWPIAVGDGHHRCIQVRHLTVRVFRGGNFISNNYYRAYVLSPEHEHEHEHDPRYHPVYCSTLLELRAALLAFAYPEGNHDR